MPDNFNLLDDLNKIIKECESGVQLSEVIEKLELPNNRTTNMQVAGAIRLAGYRVERKVVWDKKLKRSVSVSIISKS